MSNCLSPFDQLWRSWSQLCGLTVVRFFSKLNFPNNHRRSRRLCRAPHGKKSGFFYSCHQNTSFRGGRILARRRPGIREAPAAVIGRGASLCLFLRPNTLNNHEVSHV